MPCLVQALWEPKWSGLVCAHEPWGRPVLHTPKLGCYPRKGSVKESAMKVSVRLLVPAGYQRPLVVSLGTALSITLHCLPPRLLALSIWAGAGGSGQGSSLRL